MIYQDVEFFLEENEKKLPKESIRYLYFQLLALNDYRQERILRLQLKSPTGAFLLSFFFRMLRFRSFLYRRYRPRLSETSYVWRMRNLDNYRLV